MRRPPPQFGQLIGKQRILRKLLDQFGQLRPGQIGLLFAQGHQRKQNLGKGPQVAALCRGNLQLPDAAALVAADSGEAEEEPLGGRQAADNVVGHAQREVSIGGVRGDGQKPFGKLIRLADLAQAFHLIHINQAGVVGLQAHTERHGEQATRIIGGFLQAALGQVLRPLDGGKESRAQRRVGRQRVFAQKTLVVQKELRSQNALPVALLEQIAGRFRGIAQRIFRMRVPPGGELLAGFNRLLLVKQMKTGVDFRRAQDPSLHSL